MDMPPWLCFARGVAAEPTEAVEGAAAVPAGPSSGLRAAVLRLRAPFEELAADLRAGELLPSCASLWDGAQGPLVQLGEAVREVWERASGPVLELLDEEEGPGSKLVLLAAAAPCTLVASAHPALLLSGLSWSNKALYGVLGVTFATGAWEMLQRMPQESDRGPMKRSAIVLGVSAVTQLMLAGGWTLPPRVLPYVAHPDILCRFIPDLIIMPLLVLNSGFIAGKPYEQIAPQLGFAFLSAVGFCAAAVVPDQIKALQLMGTGTLCMIKAAYDIETFPGQAQTVAALNKVRAQLVADALVFSWMGYPLVQGLGLIGALTVGSQMRFFVCLDVMNKFGVCHVLLRSHEAYQNAVHAIAVERRRLAGLPAPPPRGAPPPAAT